MRATLIERSVRAQAMRNRQHYLRNAKPLGYSDEFYTPARIVNALGTFDLDPCAGPETDHAEVNFVPPQDGLSLRWNGRVFVNPPYWNIHEWIDKFVEHGDGIFLANGRCETKWFQDIALFATALLFLKGRIKFERPEGATKNIGPVGSVLIAYGKRNAEALRDSGLPGILAAPLRLDGSHEATKAQRGKR